MLNKNSEGFLKISLNYRGEILFIMGLGECDIDFFGPF